jgi:hypothetical protein
MRDLLHSVNMRQSVDLQTGLAVGYFAYTQS